jgi:hypothetical protein
MPSYFQTMSARRLERVTVVIESSAKRHGNLTLKQNIRNLRVLRTSKVPDNLHSVCTFKSETG